MNVFYLKEYWQYCLMAKGRHSVHSPAIYRFIEEALRPPARRFKQAPAFIAAGGEAWHPDLLLRRIVRHFQFSEVGLSSADGHEIQVFHVIDSEPERNMPETHTRLYDWRSLLPEQWISCFQKQSGLFNSTDVIAIPGIHDTPARTAGWQALCGQAQIRLSIDLFRLGLLLFSEDFKERQHFVLKYPA